jgi:hypothetical protein
MPSYLRSLFRFSLLAVSAHAQISLPGMPSRSRVIQSLADVPLAFEANRGQTDSTVDFVSRGNGYTIFLSHAEAVVALRSGSHKTAESANSWPKDGAYAVRMALVGASARTKASAIDELAGKANYFTGNDPAKWRTNVPRYQKVRYEDIYPGIDLIYYGTSGQLEYDFVLRPNADPHFVRIRFDGAQSLRVTDSGDLLVGIKSGKLLFHRPILYQESKGTRTPVSGQYSLSGSTVKFRVGKYDHSRELVLDPVLAYATYLGGSTSDYGQGIALDNSGAAYITGYTQSTDFPTTAGAYSSAMVGQYDAFVTKLNSSGSALVYSTYLGGSALDQATGIAVDSSGNAYVSGFTQSADFPVVNPLPAPNNTLQSFQNAFVAEIGPDGSALLYSTYLGGSQSDQANAVVVDSAGNAYIAGNTQSANFPIVNGFQTAIVGGNDGFVSEIQAGGGALLYSTFLGGSADDFLNALTLGPGSGVTLYLVGQTKSTDFPTTAGVLQSSCAVDTSGVCNDAFVAAINPSASSASSLLFSTFLGGKGTEAANAVAADVSGIYVAGSTSSSDFPTMQPEQSSYAGGSSDAFMTKLRTDGTGLFFSTFLGGGGSDFAIGIAVDAGGNSYVSGTTLSSDFPAFNALPAPNNIFQGSAGNSDAFLAKLNNTGSTLIVSTFLGGTGNDVANAVVVDSSGNAYVAGTTSSQDMPTVNAFQPAKGGPSGTGNAFMVELSQLAQPVANLSTTSLSFASQLVGTTSVPQSITLSNFGDAALNISAVTTSGDYQANGCSGSILAAGSCELSISLTPTNTGDRSGTVTITDNASGSPRVINLDGTGIAAVVSLSPASLAFGPQNVGTTSAAQTVTLTNSGSSALTVNGVTASSNYIQTNNCPTALAVNANCAIQVSFSPSNPGSLLGQLNISDNASDSPESVALSGNGTAPAVSLSPASLAFGPQSTGTTSSAQTVTITNSGSSALTVTGITVSANYVQTNNCPATLAANANCTIQISFSPSTTGSLLGQVSISDNATGSPQLVSLSGTGTAPAVSLSPTSLAFGSQNLGTTSSTQFVTLTNSGSSALTVTGITVSSNYFQSNNCPATLAVSGNCTIQVSFSPTSTGSLLGQLNISDNAPGSPQSVSLSGTGNVVLKQATTTSLSASPNPSIYNQQLTFTAVVAGPSGVPTGLVNFADGAINLGTGTLSGGVASFTISSLAVGSHSITAAYGGDTNFSISTSPALSQAVNKAGTTTGLVSNINPSLVSQAVTFTATVAGQYAGMPTGSVTFKLGTVVLKVVTLANAQASYTSSYSTAGSRLIKATYSGDANFLVSNSTAVNQVVNKVSTTSSVTSSQNPSIFGQTLTFTNTVLSNNTTLGLPTPTGTVTFLRGAATLGAGTLSGGVATFTTSSLAAGTFGITASYAGDANYAGTHSSNLSQVVNKGTTTTALISSSNPATAGQSVSLTATVSPEYGGTISGTVTFKQGTTTLATAPTNGGVATYSTSSLPSGSDIITATYNGSPNLTTSSMSTTQTIYQSASCSQELFTGFEGGTNGNTVDAATLGNNTFGYQIGSWTLTGGTIRWSNTMSQGLQNPTAVLCGTNQSYPAGNSTLSIVETGTGIAVENRLDYRWNYDGLATLSANVWFYSDRVLGDARAMDVFSIRSKGSEWVNFMFNASGGSLKFILESPASDSNGLGGSGGAVLYTPGTWVNLRLQYNNSGHHYGAVYDINGAQIGNVLSVIAVGSLNAHSVGVGHIGSQILNAGKHNYWDSLQIFYEPVNFPELPQ